MLQLSETLHAVAGAHGADGGAVLEGHDAEVACAGSSSSSSDPASHLHKINNSIQRNR